GLQLTREGCRHKPVDGGPIRFFSGDVASGVVVRVQLIAASPAAELRWRLPVRFLTMPTLAPGPARVSRVYQVGGHTGLCRFVGQEATELKEGPGMPLIAILVSTHFEALACLACRSGLRGRVPCTIRRLSSPGAVLMQWLVSFWKRRSLPAFCLR